MIGENKITGYLEEIISYKGEPGKTCEKFISLFKDVFKPAGWGVFILDEETGQFEKVRVKGLEKKYLKEIEVLIEEGIVDWVLEKGVPALFPFQKEVSSPQKKILTIPLKTRTNRKVGVIFVLCGSEEALNESLLKILSFLSSWVALVIENHLLQVKLSRQKEEEYIFFRIYQGVESNKELRDILRPILELSLAVTQSRYGFLLKIDRERKKVSPWIASRVPLSALKRCFFSLNKGAIGYVASTGKPLIVDDYKRDIRFKDCDEFNGLKPKNLISVPLRIREEKLGVLTLCDTVKKPFYTKDDLTSLLVVASYTAVIIKNKFLYNDLRQSFLDTIEALIQAIEAKDPYTSGHSRMVTKYSLEIAKYLELSPKQVEMIKFCGLLHDIGKIGIKDTLLNKPSTLSREEYEVIKKHPVIGKKIIEKVEFLKEGLPLIYHHHERYDGKGYPDGLKGEEIPLLARILSVADAFDAMVSNRPYRKALSVEEAIGELKKNAGTQFDPLIVQIFCMILKKNPDLIFS